MKKRVQGILTVISIVVLISGCSGNYSDEQVSSDVLDDTKEQMDQLKEQVLKLEDEIDNVKESNSKLEDINKELVNENEELDVLIDEQSEYITVLNAQNDMLLDSEVGEQAEKMVTNEDKYNKLVSYCENTLDVVIEDGAAYRLVDPDDERYPYFEGDGRTETVLLYDNFLGEMDSINVWYEADGITDFDVSKMGLFKVIVYNSEDTESVAHLEIVAENWEVLKEASMEELMISEEVFPYEKIGAGFNDDFSYVVGVIADDFSVSSFFTISMDDYSVETFSYDDYSVWEERSGN